MFAVTECIGQAKWPLFQRNFHSLIDFHNIDEASRGPWSAVLLLVRMRGRAMLASLGALLFVLSLAVDPFVQQVLSYPTRANVTSDYYPPTFPSVTTWNTPGSAGVGISGSENGKLGKRYTT